jgi:hypothetical protein
VNRLLENSHKRVSYNTGLNRQPAVRDREWPVALPRLGTEKFGQNCHVATKAPPERGCAVALYRHFTAYCLTHRHFKPPGGPWPAALTMLRSFYRDHLRSHISRHIFELHYLDAAVFGQR